MVGHNVRIFWNISHFLAIINHLTEIKHIKYMALGQKGQLPPSKTGQLTSGQAMDCHRLDLKWTQMGTKFTLK